MAEIAFEIDPTAQPLILVGVMLLVLLAVYWVVSRAIALAKSHQSHQDKRGD